MQKEQSKQSDTKINNYIFDQEIGHGTSGTCYKAYNKNQKKICAIKKISINSIKGNSLKLALKQVQVLKTLNHPNIIKYYDSFADTNYLYIIMQYAQKGDLHSMLKRRKLKKQFYPQPQIWQMSKQLLQAVKYLHSKNIIHRDIKTLNIFIGDKNNLLLGDLGVSKIIKNDMPLYSRVGTPLYLPPQIIKYEKYDYKADIWGFGCVIYLLTSLSYPFQGNNLITLGQNILKNDPKPIPNYSHQLNNFIKLALQKNPNKRLNATQLSNLFYSKTPIKNTNPQQPKAIKQKKIPNITKESDNKNQHNNNSCYIKKQKSLKNNHIDLTESQNKIKIITIPQYSKQDQTVVLPQSSNLKNVDAPHEKTRIRTQFLAKKKTSFVKTSQQPEQPPYFFQPSPPRQKQSPRISISQPITFSTKSSNPPQLKQFSIKIQTQPIQLIHHQNPKQPSYIKSRNIQSACLQSSSSSLIKKQLLASYRGETKQFHHKNQINNYLQQQNNKYIKKSQTRPKSCFGRKTQIIHYQSKYIKRKKIINHSDIYQTKTQLLRKPQFIVI